jgi:hypothetical protein
MRLSSLSTALALALLLSAGCGGGSASGDFTAPEGSLPFGGRTISFQSTYVYFPSDFTMALVRDTMPQDEACRRLKMYASSKPPFAGLPALPYDEEHYALVINIDSVQNPDEVTIDPTNTGGAGDMRYAGLGLFTVGSNSPYMAWAASGFVRITDLEQYQHAAGDFHLQFAGGERIEQSFDVQACP